MEKGAKSNGRLGPRWDPALGNRALKRELASRGLSLAALARLSGLSYYRVIRPALGYSRPSAEVREATAKALNMSPSDLWGDQ